VKNKADVLGRAFELLQINKNLGEFICAFIPLDRATKHVSLPHAVGQFWCISGDTEWKQEKIKSILTIIEK